MPKRIASLNLRSHKQETASRPSPSKRGYGRDWQRARAYKLASAPFCEQCERDGRPHVAANEVDHIRAINAGGDRFDPANLQSLCKPCHSRKTRMVDGGLGQPKQQGTNHATTGREQNGPSPTQQPNQGVST